MIESQQDIERRKRLEEFFKSKPEIWVDILEEFKMSLHNEAVQLNARTPTNREWSAGYVYAYGEVLDIERYYRKVWTAPALPQK